MNKKDTQRLADYLRLTDSNQDGEALTALRFARNLMRKNKLEWDHLVFGQSNHVCPEPVYYDTNLDEDEEDVTVADMLRILLAKLPATSSRADFVRSCNNQFNKSGSLSPKQTDVIKRFYNELW